MPQVQRAGLALRFLKLRSFKSFKEMEMPQVPFACHSERSEESSSFPAQGKLRARDLRYMFLPGRSPNTASPKSGTCATSSCLDRLEAPQVPFAALRVNSAPGTCATLPPKGCATGENPRQRASPEYQFAAGWGRGHRKNESSTRANPQVALPTPSSLDSGACTAAHPGIPSPFEWRGRNSGVARDCRACAVIG
jgi:hypothetical protein